MQQQKLCALDYMNYKSAVFPRLFHKTFTALQHISEPLCFISRSSLYTLPQQFNFSLGGMICQRRNIPGAKSVFMALNGTDLMTPSNYKESILLHSNLIPIAIS